MQKITPFLWFDDNAEKAVNFYLKIFKNGKINSISRYDAIGAKKSGRKAGSVMVIGFSLLGQNFQAINGGPYMKINEAVSFVLDCKDQKEVDYYWNKLSAGGKKSQCGWLTDKFGVTWQIVPRELRMIFSNKVTVKTSKAMAALLKMKKIDIKKLLSAYHS